MVKDTRGSGQDDVTKSTSREEQVDPGLNLAHLYVVPWRDNTGLVKTPVELNNDLSRTVVIDKFELSDVAMALHDTQELNNDLGRRAD